MNAYKNYFDRQTLSPEAHDRLMELEAAPAKKKPVSWQKWGALAACAALILGVGAYGLGQAGGTPDSHRHKEPVVDPLASPDPQGDVSIGTSSGEGDRCGFLALSGSEDKMMFPTLPDITYTEGSVGAAASIAFPDGAYANPLHEEDVELMLWGSLENKDYAHFKAQTQAPVGTVSCTVPAALFWDGFGLTGEARYDGEGNLWLVTLQGTRGDEHFTIEMAPGQLPPACLVPPGGETSEVNGVEVEAWHQCYDSNGDGVKEHHYDSAFLTNGIGVRARFVIPETAQVSREENGDGQMDPLYDMLSDLFIKYVCGNPSFTLDHLLTDDNIPPWEETNFETLAQARERTEFAPYLPQTGPGFGDFYGHLSYQEGEHNYLFVRWEDGGENHLEVEVRLPEGGSNDSFEAADVNAPESYDVGFYNVTFHAQDLSLEVVKARDSGHYLDWPSFHFSVLHENGVVVSYTANGLTAEELWALIEPTLG